MAPRLDPDGSPTAGPTWMVEDGHATPAIVCPLDGSEPSRRTTALAAGLARRLGWRLALVPLPLGATAADRRERLIAAAVDERAKLIACPATSYGLADAGAPPCLALAEDAPCPVLAVPLTGRWQPTRDGSVVCGVDGSDSSALVARTAARLAMGLGARLELVHVAAPPANGTERRGDPGSAFRAPLWQALHALDAMPPVDLVLELGEPARRLCAHAESQLALLVIGTPTKAGAIDEGEGGVASATVAESHLPVVLVPTRPVEAPSAPPTARSDVPA